MEVPITKVGQLGGADGSKHFEVQLDFNRALDNGSKGKGSCKPKFKSLKEIMKIEETLNML